MVLRINLEISRIENFLLRDSQSTFVLRGFVSSLLARVHDKHQRNKMRNHRECGALIRHLAQKGGEGLGHLLSSLEEQYHRCPFRQSQKGESRLLGLRSARCGVWVARL
jgi:hypothetical protein